jgi:hypothetical protein
MAKEDKRKSSFSSLVITETSYKIRDIVCKTITMGLIMPLKGYNYKIVLST